MNSAILRLLAGVAVLVALRTPLRAGFTLNEISPQTKACVDCHKKESAAIYQQWGASKHFRGNVGCYECHMALPGDPDAFLHYDQTISTMVTPKDCGRCHEHEVGEFNSSHHAKAGRILGSLDNVLAEVVEGNTGLRTKAFPAGVSAAAVNGCWQCHGAEVKLKDGRPDPAIWPNTGIGRINPDGSEGSCAACHFRHDFSVAQARTPDTCGKCHLGPDHPQLEIYNESKHGIAYRANVERMALNSSKWIAGEDYSAGATCATCHMSATTNQRVTHDVGLRISWNNRPELSVRPEVSDAKLGLATKNVGWQARRTNMRDVCRSCHNEHFVDSFYTQYDALIDLYHEKFGRPGLALYQAAQPLLNPVPFSNALDFTWYEIWHHEGRRARHGASMMGPDYTHWHGTYEVARHFYAEYIPALNDLAERNRISADPLRTAAAENLARLLDSTLNGPNHQWYLNKMSPEEKANRERQRQEFQQRYSK